MELEQDAADFKRQDSALSQQSEGYEDIVKQAVSSGQLLTAIEVARDGIGRFGKTPLLQQQLALALAQTGAVDAAHELLAEMDASAARDEETLCLFGRVHKEVWRRALQPAEAAEGLRLAMKYYGDAFERHSTYYPGINFAFTVAASGDMPRAVEIARKVAALCKAELAKPARTDRGWLFATLGEALLYQGATTEAGEMYRKAAELLRGRWRDLASARRQAREVMRFQRENSNTSPGWDLAAIRRRARSWFGKSEPGEEWLDQCFAFPTVAVFSGHMIDLAGRTPSRFPPEREAAVREEIRLHLLNIKAGFGYSSAASGGDIIFCECLLDMGANVHLILPCPVDAFRRQSVSPAGENWERRFHHVLAHATTCLVVNPSVYRGIPQAASPAGLVFSNRVATGLAALQSRSLDLELHALALWDGQPGELAGGTGSVVEEWERQKIKPHIITPFGGPVPAASSVTVAAPAAPTPEPADPAVPREEIKAMLFASIVNFQKIGGNQLPAFIEHFKRPLARLMAEQNCQPQVAESWAGIHYFMYENVQDAARCALAMRDLVMNTPWKNHDLPADLGIRIVIHAGPVYAFRDPTLQRTTCIGPHVNRAARIEHLTPPGQIYATQEFAALCGREGVSGATFEYLGFQRTTTMFEEAALYRLDRTHDDLNNEVPENSAAAQKA